MARDHARIRLDIWADDDYRQLTSSAQWLYQHLLTSPQLSFAGVADWRPARIAAHTADLTARDVEVFAAELEDGDFVVIDRASEEVLVRSFVKHDGLLRSPNMSKALVKAHAEIASSTLRAVVIDQLKRLEIAQPDLAAWNVTTVEQLLAKRSMTVTEAFADLPPNPSRNPSRNPSAAPSLAPSGCPSPNPSGSPSANPSPNPPRNRAQLTSSLTPFLTNSLPPSSSARSSSHQSPHQATA